MGGQEQVGRNQSEPGCRQRWGGQSRKKRGVPREQQQGQAPNPHPSPCGRRGEGITDREDQENTCKPRGWELSGHSLPSPQPLPATPVMLASMVDSSLWGPSQSKRATQRGQLGSLTGQERPRVGLKTGTPATQTSICPHFSPRPSGRGRWSDRDEWKMMGRCRRDSQEAAPTGVPHPHRAAGLPEEESLHRGHKSQGWGRGRKGPVEGQIQ